MSDYENINKLLNKGQRILDEIAMELVNIECNPDKNNVRKIVDAMSLLHEIRNSIWQAAPELAVDTEIDPNKQSTYLKEYRALLVNARRFEDQNDIPNAILALQKALDMEPPDILYEVVEKELARLKD